MSDFFLTTNWTRVVASCGDSPEAKQALCELCAAYYAPVLAFLRQSGHPEDAARDLAHEFFASLLERHGLEGADPQRGRFRTYLLGAVKHFVANQHLLAKRQKRGGGAVHQPLTSGTDTTPGFEVADHSTALPDALFDREWALNLLERSLDRLARECEEKGNLSHFEILKPWLTGVRTDLSQVEAARCLKLSDGAVRVAIHRLRRRFRELVKAEIAQTVDSAAEVDQELAHLIAVLS